MSLLEQIPSMEIGERLRLAREALNIKQAQAADAIRSRGPLLSPSRRASAARA